MFHIPSSPLQPAASPSSLQTLLRWVWDWPIIIYCTEASAKRDELVTVDRLFQSLDFLHLQSAVSQDTGLHLPTFA